ncbi:methyltransferase domain-containing protein [Streptomyces sp. NBC_01288]|uniref:class I SAM-dependent DNA methyltransferase n=1 Tax=Streptomyces sp. NBC_01288 TaxID=2903814 RepID=UPI002E0D6714|nr:methyltransferase domain-containing protein [Streptomyces sp. NBC_01288]
MSRSRPFYADHAAAYDLLITDPVEPWVDAVHDVLVRTGHYAASVLDAGCGTGRHAAALAAKGHRVDLADAAVTLLDQAAKRCPAARRYQADLCSLDVGSPYQAVICRGVLNDMITDLERDAVLVSLESSLRQGGLLILDVRDEHGSRARADGTPHERTVELGPGKLLIFTSTVTWQAGLLRVHEQYDLLARDEPRRRSSYDFTMRPWSRAELRERLSTAGFHDIEIGPGVGRKTADRLFIVAVRR